MSRRRGFVDEVNPFVLLARGLVYAGVLLLCAVRGGPDDAARAALFAPVVLFILVALEVVQRWRQTRGTVGDRPQHRFAAWVALADFVLVAALTLWLDQALSLLFGLVIVADGILAGWRIALLLGLGAGAVDALVPLLTMTAGWDRPAASVRLLFWLGLAGITAALSWQHERECQARTELEKTVQVRSDRLSMLSHEIRTPLTLMRASLELLFDESAGPLTEQQRTFLETIYQNDERIATLAQNLLTQARLESGVFSPKTQPVDLRRIVRLVVNDMRILIKQREQQIRTYYPQVLPPAPADPGLIRQVLINLIQNASRHTSEGGLIVVSIAQNDYALLVSVTDDGAGMGLEHRRQLFKRFSTSEANSGEGTGLGLVIVKQIVEWHGGKVYVDTSLGRGTSFYFTLPFDKTRSTT
ncbi:MAG: HAMP domain-containing sensor histidine kinase [Chloroflexota bacterium]|nr:HAMP domain-containing sensor histidine kinase [Chloroflexota bacterium]